MLEALAKSLNVLHQTVRMGSITVSKKQHLLERLAEQLEKKKEVRLTGNIAVR